MRLQGGVRAYLIAGRLGGGRVRVMTSILLKGA